MSNAQRTLEKELATKKAMFKTLQEKCQLQAKKIKLLRKENDELKTSVEKQTQIDTTVLLNSKQLSDANSKLETAIAQMQAKLAQPAQIAGPSVITVGNSTVNEDSQELDLVNQGLKDDDLNGLGAFSNLRTLIFGENLLEDGSVEMICGKLTQVRKLYLNHNMFKAGSLENIGNLMELRLLDIRNNKLGDECLKYIGKVPNLSQLSISENKITDKSTPQLTKLKFLTYLDITNNEISDEGMKSIIKLEKVIHLYISSNKLTGLSARWAINDMKELAVLDVRFNSVDNEDREGLKAMKPEALQIFV